MIQLDQFLTKNKLWQYCHHLIWADKLSQNTVRRKLAGLKKFCQWAVAAGLVNKNPFEKEGKDGIPVGTRLGTEEKEGLEGVGGVRKAILKLGLLVVSLVIGFTTLKVSLTHLPSSPEVTESIPLPRVLSQTSGFGRNLGEIGLIREIGEIGTTASGSARLRQLADKGQLVLPEGLGIEAKEITLKTADGHDGSITFNPDGQGILNFLFEGQSAGTGGFINIQNANLQEGNLISASVANDQTEYNFLQFQGGVDLSNRFTVDGQGNIEASGGLNLDSGQISSSKNLVFSPQDQPTLVLAPKQSLLKGNLAISGQIFDAGLGIFGTTGERLSQAFDFTNELTIEFEFLTGAADLVIKFNLNEKGNQYYQVLWQTDKTFAIQTCDPDCTTLGSTAFYPFEESIWHHGRIHINNSYLTWELDLSAQKVSVPVQIKDLPLLSSGYVQFSESFEAIANLKISQGSSVILTSGHGQVGGNLEVAGGLRVGELADQSASTHVCYNANGDLAECSADYAEWYPITEIPISNDLSDEIAGTLVSITNIPNPVDDPTARYMAALSKMPYDRNILGVLADPSAGANGKKLNDSYQPLVLAGRVPVKVSGVNGPIEVGDPITSSAIPGVGMRATEAGVVVGKALEPSGKSGESGEIKTILVFINPGWWEPEEKYATREAKPISGFTKLVDSAESSDDQENNLIQLNSLVIERLRSTGQPEIAEELIGDLLARVEELEDSTSQLDPETAQGETSGVAQSASREVEEVEELASNDSESSVLLADVEEFIQELQEVQVSAYTNDITNDISVSEDIVIYKNEVGKLEMGSEKNKINPQLLIANYQLPTLTVAGSTSLGETTIAGNLLVDSSLQLAVNSINSLNNTLYLQNYGFGGVDILAGKIKIDPQGNLAVAGNLEIEKDLRVKQSLFASLIKPLEGSEIVVEGNLKTIGSGTFNKIVIATAKTGDGRQEIGDKNKDILETDYAQLQTPNSPPDSLRDSKRAGKLQTNISTNATAGTAILPAGKTELTITNNSITDDSLIYITPISPTQNKVLFVKVKKGGGYFTTGIDEAIEKNIEFNWWVIN